MSVVFGAAVLPELGRQSADYAAVLIGAGRSARSLALPGEDHFTILEQLARPDGAITLEALRLASI